MPLQHLAVGAIVLTGMSFIYVASGSDRGFWALPSLFLLIAACFHIGALPFAAANTTPNFASSAVGAWFSEEATRQAVLVVSAATALFAVGAGGLTRRRRPRAVPDSSRDLENRFGFAGFVVLASSIAVWLLLTISDLGFSFLLRSYQDYTGATESSALLPYIFYGIGLGVVLTCAGSSRRWFRPALIVFSVFALLALPIGLRGEVLFPAAAGAARIALRHRMPRAWVALIMVVGILAGINVLQQVRLTGLGRVDPATLTGAPLQGMAELGGTLRTVNAVISWREQDGDSSGRHGATYLAPFDRPIRSKLLGEPVPSARTDFRLMNVEMRARETSIGGSFIAEAYRNFGLGGALLIPLLIGLALRRFEMMPSTLVGDSLIGVVFVALLQHVRNSFAPFPAQVILGLLFVLLLAKARAGGPAHPQRRAIALGTGAPHGRARNRSPQT